MARNLLGLFRKVYNNEIRELYISQVFSNFYFFRVLSVIIIYQVIKITI